MMDDSEPKPAPTRRDFLTGRAAAAAAASERDRLADQLLDHDETGEPAAGASVRLETRAMACDFAVILNPGPVEQVAAASSALEEIHRLESQLTVYRPDSEMSRLNARAADMNVAVESQLFGLLLQARNLARETGGAFDPTSGPLVALWRRCRREGRVPTEEEVCEHRVLTGMKHVRFDEAAGTVGYDEPGVELNLGGIGKGYALDRASTFLEEGGVANWLFHGGASSVAARGGHAGHDGWPVGLRNPLLPDRRFATLLLQNQSLSTSGSGVQGFRHEGRRYGHILDPRTGWPVEGMLSVSVVAPTAAQADALSTAFFVLGLEKTREYCDNHPEIGIIVFPPPERGARLNPVIHGIRQEQLFLT